MTIKAPELLYYVATPYTDYPEGKHQAFVLASKASAELIRRGMNIICPIAQTHPIAHYGKLPDEGFKTWEKLCLALMEKCDALAVIKMPGWETSKGVQAEIRYFTRKRLPVKYFPVGTTVPGWEKKDGVDKGNVDGKGNSADAAPKNGRASGERKKPKGHPREPEGAAPSDTE